MNERIKELAEQARKALAIDAMSGGEFNMKAYEEKFAELIVRECVLEAMDAVHHNNSIRLQLYKHFGVTE